MEQILIIYLLIHILLNVGTKYQQKHSLCDFDVKFLYLHKFLIFSSKNVVSAEPNLELKNS